MATKRRGVLRQWGYGRLWRQAQATSLRVALSPIQSVIGLGADFRGPWGANPVGNPDGTSGRPMFRAGFLACCLFFFWIPKEKENRLAVKKEDVRTVIDFWFLVRHK